MREPSVVADAQGELGVARAQMAGARASALGNPYVDVQVDKGLNMTPVSQLQALAYAYFPFDLGGQRGARITEATTGEQTARDEAKYFAGRLEAKDTTVYEKSLADAEVARWVQSRGEAQLRLSAGRARFAQVTGSLDIEAPASNVAVVPPRLAGAWDDAFVARVVDKTPVVIRLIAERTYWGSSAERYKSERLPALERAVYSSVEGFKLGKIELTRVLLARRDLAIARARRLDLIEAGWRAYAELTVLSGDLP